MQIEQLTSKLYARILSTRNIADLQREMGAELPESDINTFVSNSSAVIISVCPVDSAAIVHFSSCHVLFDPSTAKALISGSISEIRSAAGQAGVLGELITRVMDNVYTKPAQTHSILPDLGKRTLVMGILNTTPDSFSDGGCYLEQDRAIERGLQMIEDGVDIIDIGGESTRPGAQPVTATEEIYRVIPVIEGLRQRTKTAISIDTTKSDVARAALDAGANIMNDISSGTMDQNMANVAANANCPVILMHMLGTPQTMQSHAVYNNVMVDVYKFLADRIDYFVKCGCSNESIIIDPGFGFSKLPEHNLEILRRLAEFRGLGCPVLMGTSRKSTIGKVLGDLPADQRLEGTAATVALSIANGADIIRVHDVKEMARVAKMTDAVVRGY